MLFMKYDQRQRMIAKMCYLLLNVQAARTHVPYKVLENKQMQNDLWEAPDDFVNHMRTYITPAFGVDERYLNNLAVSLVFGKVER